MHFIGTLLLIRTITANIYFALKMCQNFSRFYMFIVSFNSSKKSMSECVCVCVCARAYTPRFTK